jgi:hypothetical protein
MGHRFRVDCKPNQWYQDDEVYLVDQYVVTDYGPIPRPSSAYKDLPEGVERVDLRGKLA